MAELTSKFVNVDGTRIHYTEVGVGEPVLLLHGWPTSSHLWRDIAPIVGRTHRVIAPDLPGFGRSDKPLDRTYDFDSCERVIEGLLDALDVESTGLVVHDLGGPIGLMWAVRHPDRVQRLALLNTLVYPELSWAARAFLLGVRLPLVRGYLSSPRGIAAVMRMGVSDKSRMRRAQIEPYQAPFVDADARAVLLKTARDLDTRLVSEIVDGLSRLECPVRVIYGAADRILPDVAKTMRRVARDLPQAEVTPLSGCGHFLQEERPEEVGELLATFLGQQSGTVASGSTSKSTLS